MAQEARAQVSWAASDVLGSTWRERPSDRRKGLLRPVPKKSAQEKGLKFKTTATHECHALCKLLGVHRVGEKKWSSLKTGARANAQFIGLGNLKFVQEDL